MAAEVPIRGESIRLGQLLKLAGLADSGSEAKRLLAEDEVLVNGARETRRGRQLRAGDLITVGETDVRVLGTRPPSRPPGDPPPTRSI